MAQSAAKYQSTVAGRASERAGDGHPEWLPGGPHPRKTQHLHVSRASTRPSHWRPCAQPQKLHSYLRVWSGGHGEAAAGNTPSSRGECGGVSRHRELCGLHHSPAPSVYRHHLASQGHFSRLVSRQLDHTHVPARAARAPPPSAPECDTAKDSTVHGHFVPPVRDRSGGHTAR